MKNRIQTSNVLPCSSWRRFHWLNTALLAFALATPLLAESGQDQDADKQSDEQGRPHIVRPNSRPFGATYGEWAAKWWQWALSIPADPYHPLKDQEGDDAARGQSGPVWFLAGVINESGTVVRHSTVPTGKALFFPVINTECSTVEPDPFHGGNEAELRACAEGFHFMNLACQIDGLPVENLTGFEFTSPLFDFVLPANNVLGIVGGGPGQAVDHGVYVMVKALRPGAHTIHFSGAYVDGGFALDITYYLTVEDARANQFVAPPRSHAYGKSLAEWLSAFWRWAQTGSDPAQSVIKGVQLMPLPAGVFISGSGTPEDPSLYRGQLEITLDSETPFVLSAFAWIGERYNNGNPDDPMIADDVLLAGVSPYLTIDGRVVLSDANEAAFYVPATPFDPIATYPAPTSYGSIAAFAFQSAGVVGRPLSVGVHKIHLYEPYILPGIIATIYDNTWIVTAKKATHNH